MQIEKYIITFYKFINTDIILTFILTSNASLYFIPVKLHRYLMIILMLKLNAGIWHGLCIYINRKQIFFKEIYKMKKLSLMCCVLFITVALNSVPVFATDEGTSITVPVSLSYSSVYWWRGIELNGRGVGVIWPGTGLNIGNFSLTLASGISEDWISQEEKVPKDTAKSLTEMDYGASYLLETGIVALSVGAMYVQYPYYDEVNKDATDPSFAEGSLSLGLKTLLSPKASFYYDYYVKSYDNEEGESIPQNEDYYATFSISQDLISTEDGFTLAIGALIGYYNNAYLERKGFSDAVVKLEATKKYKSITVTSNVNYGRTIDSDFSDA